MGGKRGVGKGEPLSVSWGREARRGGARGGCGERGQGWPRSGGGTCVAQLKVTDGREDSEPVTVTITSGETLRPVARAGRNRTVAPGTMVRLDGASADPQGLPVKLQWALTSRPAGSSAVLDDA